MDTPRPEYPRPQFVRSAWLNLNGPWQFEIDAGDTGLERGLLTRDLAQQITVPFCPESTLSGIGHVDFMEAVWYRRTFELPGDWAGRHVLLHFQAVDYDATVWLNGQEVARHRGGFTPFSADLGTLAVGQVHTLVVRARDPRHGPQPRGKQSGQYANHGCHYTRTTGIWQTVWLEPVGDAAMKRPKITPEVAGGSFTVEVPLTQNRAGHTLHVALRDQQGVVVAAVTRADTDFAARVHLAIPAERRRLWQPGDPHLYDLTLELRDASGAVVDAATSYAGLRSVAIDGQAVKLNGVSVFQRLVLDQGFYRDGILTAPTDAALRQDIELSMAAGFNGARLHQKVFEERFLYHADRLGYLVWGEFPDWGCSGQGPGGDHQQPGATYITQWLEELLRDYSHPSIVGWCGLNETSQPISDHIRVLDDVTRGMFLASKALDPTRPVLDTSGYSHRVLETDVYDSHDYEQDPAKFAANHAGTAEGKPFVNKWNPREDISVAYRGQPYFVSEFGGILWNPNVKPGEASWGYGQGPRTIEEFYDRFAKLCAVLLENPKMFGYCYTQLTDVFQEQNGVVTFDREQKLDLARLHAAQTRRAAIEGA